MTETSLPNGALYRLQACFIDRAVERQYRDQHFKGQRKRGMAVLGIITLFGTMNLVIEVTERVNDCETARVVN